MLILSKASTDYILKDIFHYFASFLSFTKEQTIRTTSKTENAYPWLKNVINCYLLVKSRPFSFSFCLLWNTQINDLSVKFPSHQQNYMILHMRVYNMYMHIYTYMISIMIAFVLIIYVCIHEPLFFFFNLART